MSTMTESPTVASTQDARTELRAALDDLNSLAEGARKLYADLGKAKFDQGRLQSDESMPAEALGKARNDAEGLVAVLSERAAAAEAKVRQALSENVRPHLETVRKQVQTEVRAEARRRTRVHEKELGLAIDSGALRRSLPWVPGDIINRIAGCFHDVIEVEGFMPPQGPPYGWQPADQTLGEFQAEANEVLRCYAQYEALRRG
jgi:hypothetical protein